MLLKTLDDGTELADFQYDFALDGKALSTEVDDDGDLWIEGYASDWGIDRQEEAFEPGAFERGLKAFLASNPIMLYHHQYDKALGQFVDARIDSNGLWVRGRVDKPSLGSWAEDVFNKIKRGTIKSFSVGGIFKRRMTEKGPRIFEADLGEISVTPFPVNPRTHFAVVAKKAFESKAEGDRELAPGAAAVLEEVPEVIEEKDQIDAEVTEENSFKLTPGIITSEHLAADAITADHIPAGIITSDKLSAEVIGADHLSAELITALGLEKPTKQTDLSPLLAALEKLGASLEEVGKKKGYTEENEEETN